MHGGRFGDRPLTKERLDLVPTTAPLPSALACLQADFEPCIAQLRFHGIGLTRSTTLLGWLFGEKRRLNQGHPERPSPGTHLKLMHDAPTRVGDPRSSGPADGWCNQ